MRIAILMTNTDESTFSARHPKDGEKFATLIARARPSWVTEVFSVKDGVFPAGPVGFGGAIITGSPASVHDGAPWIARLETLVRGWHRVGVPLYGACFGHRVIATALGGQVDANPGGWVLGAVETVEDGCPRAVHAAHTEQVTGLPPGAQTIARTQGCPHAGYRIGTGIETTQYHPEITTPFMTALIEELAPRTGGAVANRARDSLRFRPDQAAWAERIARFFERASSARP